MLKVRTIVTTVHPEYEVDHDVVDVANFGKIPPHWVYLKYNDEEGWCETKTLKYDKNGKLTRNIKFYSSGKRKKRRR